MIRIRSCQILILITIAAAFFLTSCSGGSAVKPTGETTVPSFEDAIMQYLGDYSYTGSEAALVYEKIEDDMDENGTPFYGIQYREIKELKDLLHQKDFPVLIYFYSSQASDTEGMTAAAEDLAQTLSGRVLTVTVDALSHRDIAGDYEIEALPEFVLIEEGQLKSAFKSSEYGYWDINDVVEWLTSSGYAPDTTKLA